MFVNFRVVNKFFKLIDTILLVKKNYKRFISAANIQNILIIKNLIE